MKQIETGTGGSIRGWRRSGVSLKMGEEVCGTRRINEGLIRKGSEW